MISYPVLRKMIEDEIYCHSEINSNILENDLIELNLLFRNYTFLMSLKYEDCEWNANLDLKINFRIGGAMIMYYKRNESTIAERLTATVDELYDILKNIG